MYVLCAVAGAVASFLFGGLLPSVGASGAIFGLFGVVLAATRIHDPILDRRGRALVGQIGTLIIINLVFGFSVNGVGGNIDNAAHIGGLLAGLWLGFVLVPGNVRTVRDLWQMPTVPTAPGGSGAGAANDRRLLLLVRSLAVLALVVALLVGLAIGSDPSRFAGPGLDRLAVGTLDGAQSGGRTGVSGRRTLSRAPCGATFSAIASPPWARASSRTMARPSPVPGSLRLGSPR
jgi:hypothetical protein